MSHTQKTKTNRGNKPKGIKVKSSQRAKRIEYQSAKMPAALQRTKPTGYDLQSTTLDRYHYKRDTREPCKVVTSESGPPEWKKKLEANFAEIPIESLQREVPPESPQREKHPESLQRDELLEYNYKD